MQDVTKFGPGLHQSDRFRADPHATWFTRLCAARPSATAYRSWSSEIVGLIPKKAVEMSAEYFLRFENFRPELVLENRIAEAMSRVASDTPSFWMPWPLPQRPPGGGSASAATAAMGAALGAMVTRLAKQDSSSFEDDRRFFTEAVELDSEAFQQVMAAYKRPKEERAPFVEEALHGAAEVPLQVLERAAAMLTIRRVSRFRLSSRIRSGCGQSSDSRGEGRRLRKRPNQSRFHQGTESFTASVLSRLAAWASSSPTITPSTQLPRPV